MFDCSDFLIGQLMIPGRHVGVSSRLDELEDQALRWLSRDDCRPSLAPFEYQCGAAHVESRLLLQLAMTLETIVAQDRLNVSSPKVGSRRRGYAAGKDWACAKKTAQHRPEESSEVQADL